MVVEMVPLKGGIGGIVHPPIGRKDTTYILPSGGYMLPTTCCGSQKQPLRVPEKFGEWVDFVPKKQYLKHQKLTSEGMTGWFWG